MSLWTPTSRRTTGYVVDNFGATPTATPGASVAPGVSDAEGSWTDSGLGTLANEIVGFLIRVSDGASTSNAKRHVLDVGVDPAGGTSYAAVITDIVCGAAANASQAGNGHRFFFPLRIPAGATVGFRIAGSNATAGTVRVGMRVYGLVDLPWMIGVGQYSETIGVSGTSGTSFTPGNGANGSWVSLGTTTRECWWWQGCYQVDNATITAEYAWIEFAYGDASNKVVFQRLMHTGSTGESCGNPLSLNLFEGACRVPAGSTIYVRGYCNNPPDTGYQAAIVGIGG